MHTITRWPLERVLDARGRATGWAVVHAPVVSPDRMRILAGLLRDGARLIGMSSDTDFPRRGGEHPAGDPIDYWSLCEAWCHCFREPDAFLPHGVPRVLLSASDFTDPVRVRGQARAEWDGPQVDYVYVGHTEDWKCRAKGWELALRCLPVLHDDLGLRGLHVGAPAVTVPGVHTVASLPWPQLMAWLARARFLFAPNGLDASPRILAEALSLDVPVVVNRQILGGWKYVTARTGAFFDDEHDLAAAVSSCLASRRQTSAWFRTHHGPYLAGRRLLALLRSVDPNLAERSHLQLERRGGPGVAGRPLAGPLR